VTSNVLPLVTLRGRERDETARLVAEFLDRGGEIVHNARAGQRVQVSCECCSLVRMISVA
jgi:hypothetical protein